MLNHAYVDGGVKWNAVGVMTAVLDSDNLRGEGGEGGRGREGGREGGRGGEGREGRERGREGRGGREGKKRGEGEADLHANINGVMESSKYRK